MKPEVKTAAEIVADCWGASAPAWVKRLAHECDRESQARAAGRMGRSPSLVNAVLRNKYTGNLDAVKARVEAAFRSAVECPVLGSIDGTECMAWQNKPYCGANHHLVRMFRACRNCPHNLEKKS